MSLRRLAFLFTPVWRRRRGVVTRVVQMASIGLRSHTDPRSVSGVQVILRAVGNESGERSGVSPIALDFFYQPVRVSVRFTQNYVVNRVLAHCG